MKRFGSRATLVLLTVLGCGMLKDVLTLQRDLAREFHTQSIGVNIYNQSSLTVTFSDSASGSLSDAERAAFARRVAEFIRDHYVHYGSLKNIDIAVASVVTTGPVTTSTNANYQFSPEALGPPKVPTP